MRQVHGYPPGQVREYTLREPEAPERTTEPDALWAAIVLQHELAVEHFQSVKDIKFTIKTPTEGEKRRFASKDKTLEIDMDKGGLARPRMDLEELCARQERFVRGFLVSVEGGYTNAAGEPIANGDDLAEHGDTDIVAEVALEIERSLSLGAEASKKSDASPG